MYSHKNFKIRISSWFFVVVCIFYQVHYCNESVLLVPVWRLTGSAACGEVVGSVADSLARRRGFPSCWCCLPERTWGPGRWPAGGWGEKKRSRPPTTLLWPNKSSAGMRPDLQNPANNQGLFCWVFRVFRNSTSCNFFPLQTQLFLESCQISQLGKMIKKG